jgi:TfoX/Sxy family transcriptional regulator of competence genes
MSGFHPHNSVAPRLRIPPVAYDEDLADRIRELVIGQQHVAEKKMFGGLAFLIGGNMAISASGQGGILVRVDPQDSDKLVSTSKAQIAIMGGRPMDGWLRVASEHVMTKSQLAKWVKIGTDYARSLPPK